MIRVIIIGLAVVGIPAAFWFASQYGQPDTVTFLQATERASTSSEAEQAPKVVIEVVVTAVESDHEMQCVDGAGTSFHAEFSGSAPDVPFATGQQHKLLGHVHNGAKPYFHATQRFDR